MRRKVFTSAAETNRIQVSGIVIPVAWDGDGNPTRLAISTHGEQEYVIDRRAGKGKEMGRLLREWIQVEGILNKSGAIIIRQYSLMERE